MQFKNWIIYGLIKNFVKMNIVLSYDSFSVLVSLPIPVYQILYLFHFISTLLYLNSYHKCLTHRYPNIIYETSKYYFIWLSGLFSFTDRLTFINPIVLP
jgi:hypothetical protein